MEAALLFFIGFLLAIASAAHLSARVSRMTNFEYRVTSLALVFGLGLMVGSTGFYVMRGA